MPLIVVVEQEKRYVERIEQALSPQGWEIQGVADRAAAMQQATDSEVALLVVNSEVSEAAELVSSFSRDKGGPGAVLLVPESSKGDTSELGADEVLHKPFTDQEISLAVRRCISAAQGDEAAAAMKGGEEPAGPMAMVDDGVQLTSEDIFGDVMSELEDAFSLATGDGDEPAEEAVVAEVEPEAEAVEEEAASELPAEEPAEEEAEGRDRSRGGWRVDRGRDRRGSRLAAGGRRSAGGRGRGGIRS